MLPGAKGNSLALGSKMVRVVVSGLNVFPAPCTLATSLKKVASSLKRTLPGVAGPRCYLGL